jgi:hypothetical protein
MKFKQLLTFLIISYNSNVTYQKFPQLTLNDLSRRLNYLFDEKGMTILSPPVGGVPSNEKQTFAYCNGKEKNCKDEDKVVNEVHLDHSYPKASDSQISFITIRVVYNDGGKKEVYKRIYVNKWTITAFAIYLKDVTIVRNNLDTAIYLDYFDYWHADTYAVKIKHQIWINEAQVRFKVLKANVKSVLGLNNLRPINKHNRLRTYNIYAIDHGNLTGLTIRDTGEIQKAKKLSEVMSIFEIKLTFGFDDGNSFTYIISQPLPDKFIEFTRTLQFKKYIQGGIELDDITVDVEAIIK